MGAAAAAEKTCCFRYCVCSWLRPGIPRIAPGKDYRTIIPDGADAHRPGWSLLLGVTDESSSLLRLSRVRVARSGLILGRSDDKLEHFYDILLAKPPDCGFDASAALAPDGRSLCVVHTEYDEQPHALQLSLLQPDDTNKLPEIEGATSHCMPISYAGQIWTLSVVKINYYDSFTVVARRLLDVGTGRWEQVGDPFTSPLLSRDCAPGKGEFLQGCAVLPGAKNLFLVSFKQHGLFLTFAPDSGCWTTVQTDPQMSDAYLPIHGRGVYIEQHHAIYMQSENIIYAYKLQDDDKQQLSLDPPINIHSVCPFTEHQGYGYLARLADRLMCSVWISLAYHRPCRCHHLHAIVTTFQLRDPSLGGVEVLHSTYRRVDMVPHDHTSDQMFCFLQEFEDKDSPLLLQHEQVQEEHVDEPSEKLFCCSSFERRGSRITRCFECGGEGHVAYYCSQKQKKPISTIPSLGPSRSIPVDPSSLSCSIPANLSSRQHQDPSSSPSLTVNPATTAIKNHLFIICQAGLQSVIFQEAMDHDGYGPLRPCYVADDGDHYWHFFQTGSKIYAVSCIKDGMLEFSLNKEQTIIMRPIRRPVADPFIIVVRVGRVTVALTDTLQIFHQGKFSYGSNVWLRYITKGTDCRNRKVLISGYVVVNDDSFIVCDALTCSWLLFDFGAKRWRSVMPCAAFEEDLPSTIHTLGLLIGRCVSVDGFIYTCKNGGLAAYELLVEGPSVYISKPILLPFSLYPDCLGEDMCLDYAGRDEESGTIWFYVVGGGSLMECLQIATVKIQTTRAAGDKMIPVGIDCVSSFTRYIGHGKPVHIRCCFAASSA